MNVDEQDYIKKIFKFTYYTSATIVVFFLQEN